MQFRQNLGSTGIEFLPIMDDTKLVNQHGIKLRGDLT